MENYSARIKGRSTVWTTAGLGLKTLYQGKSPRIIQYDSMDMKFPQESGSERQNVARWLSGARVQEGMRVTASGCGVSSWSDEMF